MTPIYKGTRILAVARWELGALGYDIYQLSGERAGHSSGSFNSSEVKVMRTSMLLPLFRSQLVRRCDGARWRH
jgi:hypothetical protein